MNVAGGYPTAHAATFNFTDYLHHDIVVLTRVAYEKKRVNVLGGFCKLALRIDDAFLILQRGFSFHGQAALIYLDGAAYILADVVDWDVARDFEQSTCALKLNA